MSRFQPWSRVLAAAPIFAEMDAPDGLTVTPAVVQEADPILLVSDSEGKALQPKEEPASAKEKDPTSFWTTPGGVLIGMGGLASFLLILGSNMGTTRGRPRLSR